MASDQQFTRQSSVWCRHPRHGHPQPCWPCLAEVQSLHVFSEKWDRLSYFSSGPFYPNHFSSWDLDGRLVECNFGIHSPGLGELCIKTVANWFVGQGPFLLCSHHHTWEITGRGIGGVGGREKQTYHLHAVCITVIFSNSGVKLTSELDTINRLSSFSWQRSFWASWKHLWEDTRHMHFVVHALVAYALLAGWLRGFFLQLVGSDVQTLTFPSESEKQSKRKKKKKKSYKSTNLFRRSFPTSHFWRSRKKHIYTSTNCKDMA